MKQINALFLTRYPVSGASSRYRVHQYIPYLEKLAITCTVQCFMDEQMFAMSTKRGNTLGKIAQTIRACAKRIATLRHWKKYDVIYMQRELFPIGPPIVERFLARKGKAMFFDYDDALFIKKPSRYNPIATFLRAPKKTFELFRLVDCTVAGNNWLRDAAIEHGGHAVTIDVAEDTNRIKMHAPHSNDKPIKIGWLGSPSTSKYLQFIAPQLAQIAAEFPDVEFEIIGGGDFEMEGVNWQSTQWSLESELASLARFDIGLMPLPVEDWAKGKSGGKARTYMAAGVVPVVQAIGYNLELIRDDETGFLCEQGAQWLETLRNLINDAELRQRVALAARADVEDRFSLTGQAQKLRDLFDETLARKAGNP